MAKRVLIKFADKKLISAANKILNVDKWIKTPKEPTREKTKKLEEIMPLVKFSTIWPINEKKVDKFNLLSRPHRSLKFIWTSETVMLGCTIIKSNKILNPSLYKFIPASKIRVRFVKKNPDKGSEILALTKRFDNLIPASLSRFLFLLNPWVFW